MNDNDNTSDEENIDDNDKIRAKEVWELHGEDHIGKENMKILRLNINGKIVLCDEWHIWDIESTDHPKKSSRCELTTTDITYYGYDNEGQVYCGSKVTMNVRDIWMRNRKILEAKARRMGYENGAWKNFRQERLRNIYEDANLAQDSNYDEALCEHGNGDGEEPDSRDYRWMLHDDDSDMSNLSWIEEDPKERFRFK